CRKLYGLDASDVEKVLQSLRQEKIEDDYPDRGDHDRIRHRPPYPYGPAGRAEPLMARHRPDHKAKKEGLNDSAQNVTGGDTVPHRFDENVYLLIVKKVRHDAAAYQAEHISR